ncbi:hypothetical protein Tco_0382751 [Tanacetum coccineum]
MELDTNRGTSNLASNEANSSGSSFWNVENSSTCTTPIVDKIRKLKKLIIDGKATLVDDAGKPLKKVEYPDDHNSEDEVESVDNDIARSMVTERVGFGTKSLLEQWRDSYENGDYDEDPYDDDMYEGQDLPHKIRDIYDNLDIRVRGLKHAQSEEVQELLSKLVQDVKIISDELSEYINTPAWNRTSGRGKNQDGFHKVLVPRNLVPTPIEFEDFSTMKCDLPPYYDCFKNQILLSPKKSNLQTGTVLPYKQMSGISAKSETFSIDSFSSESELLSNEFAVNSSFQIKFNQKLRKLNLTRS